MSQAPFDKEMISASLTDLSLTTGQTSQTPLDKEITLSVPFSKEPQLPDRLFSFYSDYFNPNQGLQHDQRNASVNYHVLSEFHMLLKQRYDPLVLDDLKKMFYIFDNHFLTISNLREKLFTNETFEFLDEICFGDTRNIRFQLYRFLRYKDIPPMPPTTMPMDSQKTIDDFEFLALKLMADFDSWTIDRTCLKYKLQSLVNLIAMGTQLPTRELTLEGIQYCQDLGIQAYLKTTDYNVAQADDHPCDFSNPFDEPAFVIPPPLGFFGKIKATVDHAYSASSKIDKMVTMPYDMITMLSQTFSDAITRAFSKDVLCSDYNAMIFELCMDLVADYRYKLQVPLPRYISYISRILRLFGINSLQVAYDFVVSFKDYFDNSNQAQADKNPIEMIIALVGVIVTSTLPGRDTLRKVCDLSRLYLNFTPIAKDVTTNIVSWIPLLPVCAQAWMNHLFPETFWRDALKEDAPAHKWLSQSIEFVEHEDLMSIQYDNVKIKSMYDLHALGHDLQRQFAFCKDIPTSVQVLITQTLNKLDVLYNAWETNNKMSSIRKTPFCVCIYGESQAGKSTLANVISRMLYPKVPLSKLRYIRKVAQQFWSGYIGQPVTVYDDAFQSAEMLDALELFDLISNAPCPLDMPSLNDPAIGVKGACFRSETVILCTNTPFPNVRNVVTCENAFFKRRHVLIQAIVRPECKGEKVIVPTAERPWFYKVETKNRQTIDYKPNFGHLRFRVMDPENPERELFQIEKATDLLKFIKQSKIDHQLQQDAMLVNEDNMIEQVMQELSELEEQNSVQEPNLAQGALQSYPTKTYLDTIWEQEEDEEPNVAQGILDAMKIANGTLNAVLGSVALYQGYQMYKERIRAHPESGRMLTMLEGMIALSSAVGLFTALRMFLSTDTPNEAEGKYARKDTKLRKPKIFAQSTTDQNAYQIAKDSIGSRMCYISCRFREGQERSMCALPLGGTVLLTPYHLFLDEEGNQVRDGSKLTLNNEGSIYITHFNQENLVRLKNKDGTDKDVCAYRFGIALRPFKRIDHLFVNEQDLSSIINSDAWLMKYNKGISERQLVKVHPLLRKEYYSLKDKTFTLNCGWIYEAVTECGDCGSPLVLFDTKIPRKLLGIHVSARTATHRAYGETVTIECLQQMQHLFKNEVLSYSVDREYSQDEPDLELQGNLSFLGTLDRNQCAFNNFKTDIQPSLIFERLRDHVTEPAVLSRNDPRLFESQDPLEAAIDKYSVSALPFEPSVVEEVREHLYSVMDSFKARPIGDVGEDKAINGDSSVRFCEPLNMHTATGYPYNLIKADKTKGGKRWLFEEEDNHYSVSHPELRKRLDERLRFAKEGHRYDSLSIANLKDERRDLEKIPVGKTRHFSLFPTDYVILCKRYMQEFLVSWYGSCLETFIAVGMDPYSSDADIFMDKLRATSDIGFDGDFKAFDGKIAPEMFDELLHLLNHYYRHEQNHEENMMIRRVLVNEALHTIELARNVVYGKHGGDPSGFPLTTLFNCLVNYYYMSTAYLSTVPMKYRSMKNFEALTKLFVFGDDNVVAVDRKVAPYFNLRSVSEYLAEHDIQYVPNDGSNEPVKSVEDLSFLKNTFRSEGKHTYAMLDDKVIYEMCNWIRKSDDDFIATLDNCNTALRYAYFHGRPYFSKLRTQLYDALLTLSENAIHLYTYTYLDHVFKEEGSLQTIEELEVELNVAQCLIEEVNQAEGSEHPITGTENSTMLNKDHVDNVDKIVGVTDMQENINFMEQSGVTLGSLPVSQAPTMHLSAMEEAWTAARVLSKPQKLYTLPWTTSQAGLVVIQQFHPMAQAYINPVFRRILETFMFFRATAVIRIEVNGIRFNSGRLIMFNVPMTSKLTTDKWHAVYPEASTAVNHVFVDACDNTVAELELPFFYYENYYKSDYASQDDSNPNLSTIEPWNVYVQVFNQMRAATSASTTLNFTVWMYFKDIELRVPLPSAQGDLGIEVNFKGWDRVIEKFLPKNIIKDVYDTLMGRDKPNIPVNPHVMVRKPVGYMSNSKNVDRVQRFAFDPSKQEEIQQGLFGTNVDEMDFNFLKQRYSWLITLPLTTSNGTGTYLWEAMISPVLANASSSSDLGTVPLNTIVSVPLLGYMSLPFSYWRGGMRVKIDAVTTSFHTCKLGFYIAYGRTAPMSTTHLSLTADPFSAYTTFFEINADRKCFEFEVPYIAAQPWKQVPNGQFAETDPNPTTPIASAAYRDFFMTGYMGFFVVHPLVAPSNVANSIDLNIFVSGSDDFELAYIGGNNLTLAPSRFGFTAQSSETGISHYWDRNKAQGECVPVGPKKKAQMYPSGLDAITHVKDIVKRHHLVSTETINTNTPRTYMLGVSNMMAGYGRGSGQSYPNIWPNGISWWTAMYRAHIGSMRFKIHPFCETSVSGATAPIGLPRYAISYVPEVTYPTAVIYGTTADELLNPATTNTAGIYWQGVTQREFTNDTDLPDTPSWKGPVDWVQESSRINEFEIPWERPLTMTLNSLDSRSEFTDYWGTASPSKYCEFTLASSRGYIMTISEARANAAGIVLATAMACGDDFRMGGFMGPQPLRVFANNTASVTGTLYLSSPRFLDAWVTGLPR